MKCRSDGNVQGKKVAGRGIRRGKGPEKEMCLVCCEIAKKLVQLQLSEQRERGKGNEFEDVARGLGKDLGFYFKCADSH